MTTQDMLTQIKIIHSTWTNSQDATHGLQSHIIKSSLLQHDLAQDDMNQLSKIYDTLNEKIIIGINDPTFQLITNGYIRGQQVLDNGRLTGKFKTIDSLVIPRKNGSNRSITLTPITIDNDIIGYIPRVNDSIGLGSNDAFLSDNEKTFYSQFVFTVYEPTIDKLTDIVEQCIQKDFNTHNIPSVPQVWVI